MKKQTLCAILLMIGLALTRWPDLMPANFSAVYALIFCAAVYFPRRLGWCLILPVLLLTDILLNLHYGAPIFHIYMVPNYLSYACILWLGQQFSSGSSFIKLLGGGLLGAVLFYLITNTISFFQDPAYAKTFAGWLQALTLGVPGLPPTWMFFRNSLMSTGLFTGLFVGAMKALEHFSPQEESEPAAEEEEEEEPAPKEAAPQKSQGVLPESLSEPAFPISSGK